MTAVHIDPLDQALSERTELIRLCLYALDRARSSGVAERLTEGLDGIGVVRLRPEGLPFDPSRHEAGGTVPTDDPALDGIVAETEVPGFADRDQVLRTPVVTVYQWRPGPAAS
ncbi:MULTISPECIES: nucleotide exchange factor GrpE [Saccharopolyspora]|uniref:Nucleotide exchange factor GrpE n=1 Tax=Saccharopolyspora gregorii TaxID=33914 RepID=A0ABP6S052_9PSEU|nr:MULTISPECIES: nucleotide exchange factor GrpE [Saccharopolyspora]MCA1188406.1 nucleotide exchange factor GrpE [Saccharopolyspora sp. 6T]MCA1194816.1 nucleotide exchange factor GrpE [Saccharopolyspora sp. 6V]MCA1228977.1 nucleotide exchange factor GrpE [Saccharopolyspora sp. 6M]MCA1281282.1 nucleotide exchange factor GrpE [Saccharopolyspora sp. 7B]